MNILNLDAVKFPLNLSLDISIAMGHSIKDVEAAKTFFNQMFHGENDTIIVPTSDYTDLKLTVKSPNELLLIAIWYAPEANTYNFKIPEGEVEDTLTFALDFTFGKFTLSLD